MSLTRKSDEINRLSRAFEAESAKFHDIRFDLYYIDKQTSPPDRSFAAESHAIMLWQHYDVLREGEDVDQIIADLEDSNLDMGVRGAALTLFGVIEGEGCGLFLRMARRAGSLFSKDEAHLIQSRVMDEVHAAVRAEDPSAKPVAVVNNNPLAIWLNFLLYHLSMTNPGRERSSRIEPDPFSLSLLALESLAASGTIRKVDRSTRPLSNLRFKVAMSFPGERRLFVSHVVDALRPRLGDDAVFYDYDYKAQLARPNLDTLLERIYREQSDLLVVFLCAEYDMKEWCGLEWRAVRDVIKAKEDEHVMFVRFDDANVDGVLSIDGYIDARVHGAEEVADCVAARVAALDHDG